MGKFYDDIPANIVSWIQDQKIFFVATAPLLDDGRVNVSPKGCIDTFHIVPFKDDDENAALNNDSSGSGDEKGLDEDAGKKVVGKSKAVWYDDMTGTGVETISHLKENRRITIMFVAFEGPPQIVRLFGKGTVHEFGTPEYERLLPLNKRQPGSRAVIWVDVEQVGTSCGFSVPFFDYSRPRNKLQRMSVFFEQTEYDYHHPSCSQDDDGNNGSTNNAADMLTEKEKKELAEAAGAGGEKSEGGGEPKALKYFWKNANAKSIDGLLALEEAYASSVQFNDWRNSGKAWSVDDEGVPSRSPSKEDNHRNDSNGRAILGLVTRQGLEDLWKVLIGFSAGWVIRSVVNRFMMV